MVSDEGVASCNDPKTGEVHWAERLGVKGECASSPIHANGKIYSFSINGDCVVFEPNPEGLKILARNKLDDGCMASPAVVGDSLLVRTKQNLYRFDRTQSTAEKTVQPVFNGKDLTGWKVPKGNDKAKWYQVIDGVLQIRSGPKKKGSVLWTEKKFRDFEMEFDFRFGEGTVDSGVHLRTQDQIQIGISGSLKRDMTCSPYIPGKGYPVEAKSVAKLLKAKDWNHMKIRAIGPQVHGLAARQGSDELRVLIGQTGRSGRHPTPWQPKHGNRLQGHCHQGALVSPPSIPPETV